MDFSQVFLVIALILIFTKAFSLFMRKVHLPQVVGALIAGIVLGPAVFGIVHSNDTAAFIKEIAEIGVVLLLFTAGMETDLRELYKNLKASLFISVLGVIFAIGGGFVAAICFGHGSFESFFIGVAIASTSASITIETLSEMGKLKSKSGNVVVAASLLDDIMVIVLLAVIMGGDRGEASFSSVGIILLRILAFFIFALLTGYGVSKFFDYMFTKYGKKRRLSICAIAYCFLMAYLAEFFGLADITGAFIAGISLCTNKCGQYMETRVNQLSYMFFTPIFLANIGLQITFDSMNTNMILFAILMTIVAVLSKVLGCGLGAKLCKFSYRESLEVGTGTVARGEVSFVVASKGIAAGYITAAVFPSVIIVVLASVLITPLLMKVAYKRV